MARPTVEGVQHTQDLVYVLADSDPDAYDAVAFLVDALVWAHGEAELARKAAGWGPGAPRSPLGGGEAAAHTIGRHGLGRPVEDRLDFGEDEYGKWRGGALQPPVEPADRLYKMLRRSYLHWRRRLVGLQLDVRNELQKDYYWPVRSDDDDGLPHAQEG